MKKRMSLSRSAIRLIMAFATMLPSALAFTIVFHARSPHRSSHLLSGSQTQLTMESEGMTRTDVLRRGAASLWAGMVVAGRREPGTAYEKFEDLRGELMAKERSKVIDANVKVFEEGIKALKSFDFYIAEEDYMTLRRVMRETPFSNVRSSGTNIIANLEGEQHKEAEEEYQSFIASVTQLDRLARTGAKYKPKDGEEVLYNAQKDAVRFALNFVDIVETGAIGGGA